MSEPIFETERLNVRRYEPGDAPAMFEVYRNPDVWRYLAGGEPYASVEQTRERLEQHIQWYEDDTPYGLWAVVVRDTGELIGSVLLALLEGGPEVEVGYHFGTFAWGNGYATEVTRGAIRYGFDVLGLQQICGVVFAENVASQHVLEKAGLAYRGLRSVFGFDGVMYYTIDRPDPGNRPG
ncbi:MAG TPA: GNAT family N-acetyltransferase [Thermomicrobiales bacterium]|jgi:RimJ/RimL family protein N-acetyltransferase|nr:GNAT family N-acetyltransferase [Thermomicrobiales bacterium]